MMKKIILFVPILLVACSQPVQSVDYYLAHLDEAEEVSKKCKVTQGSEDDQNCINANDALYKDYMDKMIGKSE